MLVTHQLGDAEVRIFDANPAEGDLSKMYVLDALGVALLVRRRGDGTYVHVENEAIPDAYRPLIVEVNNAGENHYGEKPAHDASGEDETIKLTATVTSKVCRVTLALDNGPPLIDGFGAERKITGVVLTYRDGAVTAIQFTSGEVSVFVDTVDLGEQETWPDWLQDLVLEYAT